MDLGFRLTSLCLAFTIAAGLVPLPDPSGWAPAPPEPPPITAPGPPPVQPGAGMEDVSPSDWFYDAIRVGVRHGFVRPMEGRFAPQQPITRGAFITMLGRMHAALGGVIGYDRIPDLPYTDITADADYIPYLAWATEVQIVLGDAEQRFSPESSITREEMAVLLVHYIDAYALYDQLDVDPDSPHIYDYGFYADWFDISDWAWDEVHLLRYFHLMQGQEVEPGVYFFYPQEQVLRLEAVAILVRLFEALFDGPSGAAL